MLLIQFMELVAIFFVCDFIATKNKVVSWIINSIVMFFFNVQLLLMFFATSYLSAIMLSNITLIQDVSGKANVYIPNVVLMIIISLLPISHIKLIDKIKLPKPVIYIVPVIMSLFVSFVLGAERSPYIAYVKLGLEAKTTYEHQREIARLEEKYKDQFGVDTEDILPDEFLEFYKPGVESGWEEEVFSQKPNVIFIMTEGLSKSIVDDSRGIMKNVKKYEEKSLSFSNYYDHTIATYRGIIGQLYSGHQFENREDNKLINIADILEDEGYKSIYLNSEPNMAEFVEYLEKLNFDEFVSIPGEYEGEALAMSDKEDYEMLKEHMIANAGKENPYFITMYTFGTHVNLDSPHEKYGDGSDMTINRFYNLDIWFGEFMDWFDNAGEITDNTLLVFTADHASYVDNGWDPAFPDSPREDIWVDTIPCFFYHKGVTPKVIDVNGKNSINIAPTILDYINIGEDHGNFFLGGSLFTEDKDNKFNTIFYSKDYPTIFDTEGCELRPMGGKEKTNYLNAINRYFAIKKVGVKF